MYNGYSYKLMDTNLILLFLLPTLSCVYSQYIAQCIILYIYTQRETYIIIFLALEKLYCILDRKSYPPIFLLKACSPIILSQEFPIEEYKVAHVFF